MATVTRGGQVANVTTATATMSEERDVSSELRKLFPRVSPLLALVRNDNPQSKEVNTGKAGLIEKAERVSPQPEWFTFTPLAISITMSALSGTTATVSSSAELKTYDTLINTANNTACRVDSITNATTIEITSIGSTSFALDDNPDTLMKMGTAYHPGSSSPSRIHKDDDVNYNVMQRFREPVAINWEAKSTPHYFAPGGIFKEYKNKVTIEYFRKMENTYLFGHRPSSTRVTSGGAALTSSFGSMRGLYNWAQNTYNANNSLTPESFFATAMNELDFSAMDGDDWVAFMSHATMSKMQAWGLDKYQIDSNGKQDMFGVTFKTVVTNRGNVKLMPHNGFDYGTYANQILVFRPSELKYLYYKGEDIRPNNGIQDNDQYADIDELTAYTSLEVSDAGRSALIIQNCF